MSARHTPPFRAEHVGSFIRPPELVQAREAFRAGRISSQQLSDAEDQAIRNVVAMQEEVGLPVVTDGEFRRQAWNVDFFKQISGVSERPSAYVSNFRNDLGAVPVERSDLYVTGRLQLRAAIFGDHFRYLESVAVKATPKISIPSPSLLHRRGGTAVLDGDVYSSLDQFLADLVVVYRDEVAALGAIGCTYLQLDDTSFAALCDPAMRDALTAAGNDGDRIHLTYIKLINDSIRNRPLGMSVCMHTCRGNFRGAWLSTGSYDYIAEAMFSGLEIDGFLLEYDDERSGGFEPLRFVPPGKMVVLGLVTTKRGALETKDQIKRRIDEAAKHVPLEQLCLSPQCGFSCSVQSEALTAAEQRAKLGLIVETAREVWG
jgi:5-methyltetrahydropteroyltriglutamate--homocysteine methyltransferase